MQGRVPKNEYGNIELFQPSMLPEGALHMTGIDQTIMTVNDISPPHSLSACSSGKVARKLEIDYAPAMMGWDFHSGYCHPM